MVQQQSGEEAHVDVSAQNQPGQTVRQCVGDVLTQNHQQQSLLFVSQQMQEQFLGDVSAQNHQRQLRELACKNVSVKNYQEASRLVGLMTDVRDSRRARTRWCTKIAGDMWTQNQPQPPRVLNLADLVAGCGPDVGDVSEQILGDVSAQNHQRQLRDPACKNVSVKNHQEASRHVSAKNQQQQLHEHGRGVDWAQTHQQQLHEHDVGDISGKNHQRQLCEPACKNVSVQNHPWQSYLIGVEDVSAQNKQQQQIVVDLAENLAEDGHGVEDVSAHNQQQEVLKLLMSDVRSCRCALARLLYARGAGDMLAHNQPQPPLVFDHADLVIGGVHDVGDVSAQNEQQRVLSGLMTFRKTFENNQVRPGHDQGLSKQCLCSVHVALDDLMHDVVLSCEIEVHDTITCGAPGLFDIAATLQPTALSPVDKDNKGTCRTCAFFRRGAFCQCCGSGALLAGRRERRRKRLKERAEAIDDFMWFFIEGDLQDRCFGEKQHEFQDFVDSPSGMFLVEIIGRDRIWALADWWCDARDGAFGRVEYMTMRHLIIWLDTLQDFLCDFTRKSRCH